MSTFLINYIAWMIIAGFYLMIRFWGTHDYMDWASSIRSID